MSEKKSKGGRKKNEITDKIKEEAKEILELAFKDVGYIKSKLTYNSVVKFNNLIANNPEFTRQNGDLFNFLGVRFWSKDYDGKPYYGKSIIDEKKYDDNIKTGGDAFEINNKDLELLVDRYHNKPEELKKRLINLFLKDRKEILSLKVRNDKLTSKVNSQAKSIKQFEEGFATMFWNSTSTYNSLDDVLNIERPDDIQVKDELLNMFNNDIDRVSHVFNEHLIKNKKTVIDTIDHSSEVKNNKPKKQNVSTIQERLKRLGLAEEEGL